MIRVTTPDKSRIIGYSINNLGTIKINSIIQKADSAKSLLTKGNDLNKDIIFEKEFKPKEYQHTMASIVVGESPIVPGSSASAINILYSQMPKSSGKPSTFEVEAKTLPYK